MQNDNSACCILGGFGQLEHFQRPRIIGSLLQQGSHDVLSKIDDIICFPAGVFDVFGGACTCELGLPAWAMYLAKISASSLWSERTSPSRTPAS